MTQPTSPPYSRRPPQVWAAARAAYEAGASVRIVAERYQLNIRTVSRHARDEGWRAPELPGGELYGAGLGERAYDPSAFSEMVAAGYMTDRDADMLLLHPDTIGFCRFAFRRAAECASVSGPTEATAWIRLAEGAARLRRHVDVDVRPMSEPDYRRVAALAREETTAVLGAMDAAPPEDAGGEMSELSETVP